MPLSHGVDPGSIPSQCTGWHLLVLLPLCRSYYISEDYTAFPGFQKDSPSRRVLLSLEIVGPVIIVIFHPECITFTHISSNNQLKLPTTHELLLILWRLLTYSLPVMALGIECHQHNWIAGKKSKISHHQLVMAVEDYKRANNNN